MNKDQAMVFIKALNALQQWVAPVLFDSIAQSDASKVIVAVANGLVVCECKPNAPAAPGPPPLDKLRPSNKPALTSI